MKKYLVSGVEDVYDAYDEYEQSYLLKPVEVEASSQQEAFTIGAKLLQTQIEKLRRARGHSKTGMLVYTIADVREAIPLAKDVPAHVDFEIKPNIILVSENVSVRMIEHFTKYPDTLKTLNRRLFEEVVAEIWNGFGYEVELTGATRDGGKDIIAISNTLVSEKFLIECKRPDPGNSIGVAPIRELYGVKHSEGATKAIMVTTAYYTPDAKALFDKHKWELEGKDYDGLIGWIEHYLKTIRGATHS